MLLTLPSHTQDAKLLPTLHKSNRPHRRSLNKAFYALGMSMADAYMGVKYTKGRCIKRCGTLSSNSTLDELWGVYKTLKRDSVRRTHPDCGGSVEAFQSTVEACKDIEYILTYRSVTKRKW
jgi:hypothetical protein